VKPRTYDRAVFKVCDCAAKGQAEFFFEPEACKELQKRKGFMQQMEQGSLCSQSSRAIRAIRFGLRSFNLPSNAFEDFWRFVCLFLSF